MLVNRNKFNPCLSKMWAGRLLAIVIAVDGVGMNAAFSNPLSARSAAKTVAELQRYPHLNDRRVQVLIRANLRTSLSDEERIEWLDPDADYGWDTATEILTVKHQALKKGPISEKSLIDRLPLEKWRIDLLNSVFTQTEPSYLKIMSSILSTTLSPTLDLLERDCLTPRRCQMLAAKLLLTASIFIINLGLYAWKAAEAVGVGLFEDNDLHQYQNATNRAGAAASRDIAWESIGTAGLSFFGDDFGSLLDRVGEEVFSTNNSAIALSCIDARRAIDLLRQYYLAEKQPQPSPLMCAKAAYRSAELRAEITFLEKSVAIMEASFKLLEDRYVDRFIFSEFENRASWSEFKNQYFRPTWLDESVSHFLQFWIDRLDRIVAKVEQLEESARNASRIDAYLQLLGFNYLYALLSPYRGSRGA